MRKSDPANPWVDWFKSMPVNFRELLRRVYIKSSFVRRLWCIAPSINLGIEYVRSSFNGGHRDMAAIKKIMQERPNYGAHHVDTFLPLPTIDLVIDVITPKEITDAINSITAQHYPLKKINLIILSSSRNLVVDEQYNTVHYASVQIVKQDPSKFWASIHWAIDSSRSPYCLIMRRGCYLGTGTLFHLVQAALYDVGAASWEARCCPNENSKYYDPVTLETLWSDHRCILIDRKAYKSLSGYAGHEENHLGDAGLSLHLRESGYRLRYVPWATYRCMDEVFDPGKKCNVPFKTAERMAPPQVSIKTICDEISRDGVITDRRLSTPLVSVIVRSYEGRDELLRQAIQSVINQTYAHIELIVVQDGDGSLEELVNKILNQPSQNIQIRYLVNPKLGRSAAGNRGMCEAKGDFMMFLDDDDLLFADHIETLIKPLLDNDAASAAYALAFEVPTRMGDEKNEDHEILYRTPSSLNQPWSYDILLDHNFIAIQSILFKRELYATRGGLDTQLDQLEDWNLWLRYGYENKFVFVPKTTSLFRTPANLWVRWKRHALLADAYFDAKQRALAKIEKYTEQ